MVSAGGVPLCLPAMTPWTFARDVLAPGLTGSPSLHIVLATSEARSFRRRWSVSLVLGGGDLRSAIDPASRNDGPHRPIRPIGHGHGGEPQRLASEERGNPRVGRLGMVQVAAHERGHARDQQPSQVLVAHFGDAPQPLLASAGVLQRRQPQLGGELTAGTELSGIGDRAGQGRRAEEADARDGGDAPCKLAGAMPSQKIPLKLADAPLSLEGLLG